MAALKDGDKIVLTKNTMINGKFTKSGSVIEVSEKGEVSLFDGARIIGAGRGSTDLKAAVAKSPEKK